MSKSYRRDLAKLVEKHACTMSPTKGGHIRVTAPSGAFCFLSWSPGTSSATAIRDAKTSIKRMLRADQACEGA